MCKSKYFNFDKFGNLYRKQANKQTAGQDNPLPYSPIEEADISKSTNRFTSNTTYDEAGNVTQDTKFRNLKFACDANGRMIKTSNTDDTNQANSVYDASGQRVATKVYDVWTFFIYDAFGKIVAEYGGMQSVDEGGVKYLLSDWQGSTRAIVSNSGFVQARQDFTAFGEQIAGNVGQRTMAQGFGANNNLNQKYALTERDKATGLDHTWFRKLENQAGRWTSPDPYNGSMSLGNPQSFNRYSYVENQPTNFVDPSGLFLAPSGSIGTFNVVIQISWFDRMWEDYWGADNGGNFDWLSDVIYGGGSSGGSDVEFGGGDSDGGGNDPLPFNNCTEFVNYLLGLAGRISSADRKRGASKVGLDMMDTAWKGYERHIHNGFTGFKESLIGKGEGQQGAGVYGHILYMAGAYIGDRPVMAMAGVIIDSVQLSLGRPQGKEEVAGTSAGTAVGKLMWSFDPSTAKDYESLKKNLTAELCE